MSRSQLLAYIDVCMGGRVAEQLLNGEEYISTGAASDLEAATQYATRMVKYFAMDERSGLLSYGDEGWEPSEAHEQIADQQVQHILSESYQRAVRLLTKRRHELTLLAEALLEKETLSASQVRKLLKVPDPEKTWWAGIAEAYL